MRSFLSRLLSSLADLLSAPRATHRSRKVSMPGPERLEERAVPSGLASGGLTGCTCPFCHGAAYTLGGGVPGSSPYAVKWSQPGGLGSLVTITYSYSNLLNGGLRGGLPAATIRAVVDEAFSRWAAVAPLRFVEVADAGPAPSTADYNASGLAMIRLGHRPIDGGYGVLAYGYYPGASGLAGDVQFDSGENWTVNPALGQDLLEVATHEIGHALGLAHSAAASSVMRASYSGYFGGLGTSYLFADDIQGVRALYGAGTGSVTSQAPPTFSVAGTTLYVRGTTGPDVLVFDGTRGRVTMNGQIYNGDLHALRAVIFNGGAGSDRANVVGTSLAETFSLYTGRIVMTGAVWNLTAINTEVIDVTAGAGDQVTMTGSASAETFLAHPTWAQLFGGGYNLIARGFASVKAVGGGGANVAYLYGAAGVDTLTASPVNARLQGSGFSNTAQGFSAVYAYSKGGADQATLTDSAGNDLFASAPGFAALQGPTSSYVIATYGFSRVQATASAGLDVAKLYGSAAADTLIGTATYTALEAGGARWEARSFDQVIAQGQGGSDVAYLYDSAGNDNFTGQGRTGTMNYPGTSVQFINFARAVMYGTSGGVNRRQLAGLGFTVNWAGTWV